MEDSTWGYRKDDGTPVYREDVRDMYRDMLNDCHEPVRIGYLEWGAGAVLEEMDPIAFRCGVSDYWDSLLTDGEYVEDIADVDDEGDA